MLFYAEDDGFIKDDESEKQSAQEGAKKEDVEKDVEKDEVKETPSVEKPKKPTEDK